MELIRPPESILSEQEAPIFRARRQSRPTLSASLAFSAGHYLGDPTNVEENVVGWLVRTKGKDSNGRGIATGSSVLDLLYL